MSSGAPWCIRSKHFGMTCERVGYCADCQWKPKRKISTLSTQLDAIEARLDRLEANALKPDYPEFTPL